MSTVFSILARHRLVSVVLAILVEVVLLLPLAFADPASVVGIPAAVAAGIGGTVAVVLGPFAGAVVAFAGAVVFAALGGWETGELAALVVWPAIVIAAGLFARRVERQRQALGQVVAAHEAERQRLALELHDGTAQMLAASLMALDDRGRGTADSPPSASDGMTRAIIQETIESVRALAVDLRPKALDDFGLAPALESLAASFTERTGIVVDLDLQTGNTRLPPKTELAAYRLVQEVLSHVERSDGGGAVHVSSRLRPTGLQVVIDHDRSSASGGADHGWTSELGGLRERIRLGGGRLTARTTRTTTSVRAELRTEPA
jgi:signal transduction histidine kinase